MKISIEQYAKAPSKVCIRLDSNRKRCEEQLAQINEIIREINNDLRRAQ